MQRKKMNVVTSTRIWGVFALSLSDDANLLKKHLPTSFPSKLPIVKVGSPLLLMAKEFQESGPGAPKHRAASQKGKTWVLARGF